MTNPAFVIIPAFNEDKNIAEVIEAAQSANPLLIRTDEIIVVDNNSTDNTAAVAEIMGARVVACEVQGKGQAMDAGVQKARSLGATAVTFLDADLTNLKGTHVDAVTHPVVCEGAPMTAGIIDLWDNWLLERINWPSLSGERSILLDYWDRVGPEGKKGFYIETAINVRALEDGWFGRTVQVRLEGVNHDERRKIRQRGVMRGSAEYMETYTRAFALYSRAIIRARQSS